MDLEQFRQQIQGELVPLSNKVSYFAALHPFTEEDLRDYLEDPFAALPPSVLEALPRLSVLLVPYLERVNGKEKPSARDQAEHAKETPRRKKAREKEPAAEAAGAPEATVSFERPPESRLLRALHFRDDAGASAVLVLSTSGIEVADYHYDLYRHMAGLLAETLPPESLADYLGIIRDELNSHVHGEVDESSWQRKQAFLRRRTHVRRESKEFRDYARESFIDTLTLYLHGICCDIDVDTGPRQLPSRHLRRRLKLLQSAYPPPQGYAVFPEELDRLPPSATAE